MRRVGGLDLLRGVAVGLVMLRHALPDRFAGAGVVGVVMFFVISGYLITGLLTGEHARTGRVDLAAFYARRARRLLPALAVVLAAVAVVTVLFDPLGDRGDLRHDLLAGLTFTGNLPGLQAGGATFHLWTLATEEQFYLVWPLLLVLLFRRAEPLRQGLALVAAGCLAAAALTVVWARDEPDLAYTLPTVWAICFLAGGAAFLYRERIRVPRAAPVPALAGLGLLGMVELRGHALTYLLGGPVIAVLTCALLLAWREWTDVRGPGPAAVVWLGTVSYGAYLWNYPLALWLRPYGHAGAAVAVVLTLAAAAASHRWVERPFLRPRARVAVPA